MLSIGKLGKGQEAYYLDKVAEGAEDYYSGEGEVAGQWMGAAAEELGLEGEVSPEQLTAMLTGRNPVDGEPLLGRQGVPGDGSVPGFDLTFSAPKSVSLLWGLGGPVAASEVSDAHRESVEAALDYMQREACWTRRGAGGSEFVPGNGYLAAAYVHRSSRNGDPQLHTHVLIANATRGPDGRWTRLYHPAIYNHAKTASYIYEANLRHELTLRLGVEWREPRKGIAEIEGFADEHLRAFSTRRAEILEAAGPDASARSRQVAALSTRETKERDVSQAQLLERWRDRADQIGLDRATIERAYDPELRLRLGAAEARTVSTRRVDRAVSAAASHFDRRDAIQAVADSLRAGAPAAEVERLADAYLASDSVISLGIGAKGERFTTRRIWELERTAFQTAARMRAEGPEAPGELVAARVIGKHPTLKDDQREMVRRLLVDSEGIVVVIGEAGTGKTYATAAAAEGWAESGMELYAGAPTWRAANVLRAEGLPASSVAGLLVGLDRVEQMGEAAMARGSILLIDEAGMVDSATLARLIAHASEADAKLVLIGDPEQLGEIEAGGLFRALAERSDPIYLDEVIRHCHEAEREGAKLIREGDGAEAIDLYRSEERVVVAANAELRREAMIADWHESFARGEDAVMVAKRNVEVERLNAMARQVRREAGELGAAEIEVGEARFAAGDLIITRVNDHAARIYNRERWQVEAVDAERQAVLLQGIDRARRGELDADYLARTNPHNDAPALEHAYAVTTYSAQGTTVDRAFVMADPSMDKQELYVAASRSREQTYLYATPEIQVDREDFAPRSAHLRKGLRHIAEAAERDRAQTAAHDEALRAELRRLPIQEIAARRAELHDEVRRERLVRDIHIEGGGHLESAERQYREAVERRGAVEEGDWRQRRRELPKALEQEDARRAVVERVRAGLERYGQLTDTATREDAIARQILAERRELAVIAARIAPPAYITKELGERPTDTEKRRSWEAGVRTIEGYRQEYGVKDRNRAFGRNRDSNRSAERGREEAQRRLREFQRALGRLKEKVRVREMGRSLGIGR